MKRVASLGLLALALASCANVLGLGDYADAPPDGGGIDAAAQPPGDDGSTAFDDATAFDASEAAAQVDSSPAADAALGADAADDSPADALADHSADAIAPDAGNVRDGGDACAPVEDCSNGVDDNCDGLVDCADPQCGAWSCVATTPPGWQGPVALYLGSGSPLPAAPSCPSTYPDDFYDGYSGLNAPPPQCSCSCGAPSGVECSATASFFKDQACGTACGTATLTNSGCANLSSELAACGSGMHMTVSAVAPGGGSCTPSASSNVPAATWTSEGRACSRVAPLVTGGCTAGAQQCAPKPSAPFGASLCVVTSGATACPSGPYSAQHVFYETVADTRGCSACTCGAPTGASCASGASLQPMSDTACANPIYFTAFGAPATCRAPAQGENGLALKGATASGGSCAANGGAAIGQAAGANATTVCCMP